MDNFECTNCGKRYKYKRNLQTHMKLECGKEPHLKCPYCEHRTKIRRLKSKRVKRRMPLAYERKTKDEVESAVAEVRKGGSIRKVAKKYSMSKSSLSRHVIIAKRSGTRRSQLADAPKTWVWHRPTTASSPLPSSDQE
ncbi:uncharacterized protein LOC120351635 [Nilaparvata lugens]|uniref:uncharacterized protein LOC120351635 n=1 Tax=Nilaparvata lugens TaxID=108931 RepID=UPI00193EB6D4|nr:uncharacterized protein LOC120351635 [Nilaparvata lugens]